jgi:transcriptional regulator with XRE-family HTH domain
MALKKRRAGRDIRLAAARILHALRVERGLTQREASVRLNKSYSWVSLLENGLYSIKVQDLVDICDIYGADPIEVFERILRWKP